jgi:hypothetical protein
VKLPACGRLVLIGLVGVLRSGTAQTTPFAKLIDRLSEPGGSFTGDNLVSNETSYLHVLPALRMLGVHGGAFIGVGPEQNFSYIAAIEPDVALVIDIRRDNALLHLLYKAMFEESTSRLEYLCRLYSRPVPADVDAYRARDLAAVLAYLDRTPFDPALHERSHAALVARIVTDGVALSAGDRATLRRFHDAIAHAGLSLKFELPPGRMPSRDYPVVRRLYTERDLAGHQVSYVATEARWNVVRALEVANKVIPVTGDLAGTKAMRAMGDYLREIHEPVSALYVSNVEFYLRGSLGNYAANVLAFPVAANGVIIRSWFEQGGRTLPSSQPGHFSTQLLETFSGFRRITGQVSYGTYGDLIADSLGLSGARR